MDIVVVGISHHTAPIDVREKLAFPRKNLSDALTVLKKVTSLMEAVIVSTCNRVEIYVASEETVTATSARIRRFLSEYHKIAENDFANVLYTHHSMGAVKHLFRVASSLDSMVVGEAQILGQIKESYEIAKETGFTGVILNTLFQRAFNVAKQVRSSTDIGEGVVSISSVAVDLAKKIFGELNEKSVMVIGAGPMSELTLQSLVKNGTHSVIVSNRHYEKAVALAQVCQGEAVRFDDAFNRMPDIDIVISSTGAPQCIISKENIKEVLRKRKNRPILLIDIAVPRDIDPQVNQLDNVYLYDIDDLQKVANENLMKRQQYSVLAEQIIETEQQDFLKWYSSLAVTPTIKELIDKFDDIRMKELEKTLHQLSGLSEQDKEKISHLTQRITHHLLHYPIKELKRRTAAGDGYFHTEAVRDLFELDSPVDSEHCNQCETKCSRKKDLSDEIKEVVNR